MNKQNKSILAALVVSTLVSLPALAFDLGSVSNAANNATTSAQAKLDSAKNAANTARAKADAGKKNGSDLSSAVAQKNSTAADGSSERLGRNGWSFARFELSPSCQRGQAAFALSFFCI